MPPGLPTSSPAACCRSSVSVPGCRVVPARGHCSVPRSWIWSSSSWSSATAFSAELVHPEDSRPVLRLPLRSPGSPQCTAIYTARANLAPLVLEGEPSSTSDQPGGQLMLTTDVENFPGFPEGIMGPELMMNFRMQAERFGAEIQTVKVTRVNLSSAPYGVWVGDPDSADPTYRAHSLIIATGAQSIMLGLDRETELIGHGLSTCATCDGFFFRDHHIAVVGGGDSALEEANFLSRFAEKVTIIHRRDELRASKIMQDRAFNNPKIEFLWDTVVTEYLGDQSLAGVKVENVKTGETSELPVTGMFIAIGHRPGTDLYKGQLAMKENGYLETVPGRTATDVAGVFAVGDVTDDYYRQAITAAGSGCQGALEAERYLETLHDA
ncbi:MAG: thioredoxin-disulfide reductase [Actinobacteria bacterium]|nr:thioredoxin-disulfide reductase [Actinomycetota bacterium]